MFWSTFRITFCSLYRYPSRTFTFVDVKYHFSNNVLFQRMPNGKTTSLSLELNRFLRFLSTASNDGNDGGRKFVRLNIKNYIKENKAKLRDTEQNIKDKSSALLNDFKETKEKVKIRMDHMIKKENIYTIPNFLCLSRIVISPFLGMLIIQAEFQYALVVLSVAAITDLLDGWIARTWISQSSSLGSFLDPMADKVLIATLFLTLTYAELIPVILTGMIIARDILLVAAGFVIRYHSLPPPKTLSRYFDASHATAQLAPTFISKVNTGIQLLLVGSTLAAPVFQYVNHPVLQVLWYLTGVTTIAAGLSYVLSKNTYKIFKKNK